MSDRITRREALRRAAAVGAAAVVPPGLAGASDGAPVSASDAAGSGPARPTRFPRMVNLTAAEAEILAAMVDRLIPTDELGPGALDSGVLDFIDRALGEAEPDEVDAYRAGLAALDRYATSSRGGAFVTLSARDQDSVLIDVQTGAATGAGVGFQGSSGGFFDLVRGHTWQGMFGDPRYGGNGGFAGWDLIRYPGMRMRVTDDEQRALEGGSLPPARGSAYDLGLFQTRRRG